MPFKIIKNKDGTFKVVAKTNPHKIYAYGTTNPTALIKAIEAGYTKNKKKTTNVKSTKTTISERKK